MIVIDIETSGIDPIENSILSIGAVDFESPKRQFYKECRLRKEAKYSTESLMVNGFSVDEIHLQSKPSPKAILNDFASWASLSGDHTPAGHNVHFDVSFIEADMKRYGIDFSLGHRNVDMHALAYANMLSRGVAPPIKRNRTDLNSDTIFEYVGIGKEPRPHNALKGAMMETEALSRLIYGKGILKEYDSMPVPECLFRQNAKR